MQVGLSLKVGPTAGGPRVRKSCVRV